MLAKTLKSCFSLNKIYYDLSNIGDVLSYSFLKRIFEIPFSYQASHTAVLYHKSLQRNYFDKLI